MGFAVNLISSYKRYLMATNLLVEQIVTFEKENGGQ